jgi:hypothetical protein
MNHSRQTLIWTAVGSVAAVISVIIGILALGHTGGSSAATTAPPANSTSANTAAPSESGDPVPKASATPSQPSIVYLSNMTPGGDLGSAVTAGPALIYGHAYPDSIGFMCGNTSSDTPGTYNLNGHAKEFLATVGVPDNWPTNYLVGGSVIGDGRTLATFSVSVLKPETIKVNVSNVEVLQLECGYALDTSDNLTYNVGIDWGDARLVGQG